MAEQDPRKAAQRAASSSQTQPGDPNFSSSDASQGQVPAAAAERQLVGNQRSAIKRMAEARNLGYNVDTKEFDQLRQMAETGVTEPSRGFIGELVGWIDGPAQSINLLIQDLVGGEAEAGYRNPTFGDYWNTFWTGVNDEDGFEMETGLNPVSRSHTLDMFGWEEAEGGDERALRGIADFLFQMATDPLTYVTFGLSGVAKKTALAAAKGTQDDAIKVIARAVKHGDDIPMTKYQQHLYDNIDEVQGSFYDDLARKAQENGGELPDGVKDALRRHFGADDWENFDEAMKLEAAVANRVHDDVIRPLAGRDFKNIHPLAADDLPAYARGGARLSVPFGTKMLSHGIDIPGTRGLGRDLVGDPLRNLSQKLKDLGVPGYDRLAKKVGDAAARFDRSTPMIAAMRAPAEDGGISGWQFHLLESAKENMINNSVKHRISTELNAQWNRITEYAEEAGVDAADVGRDILLRMEASDLDDTMLRQMEDMLGLDPENLTGVRDMIYAHPQLDEAVRSTVTYMQETMDTYHKALSNLDESFTEKFIKGYIPHKPTDAGRELVTDIARSKSAIPTGRGDAAEDIVSQLINAVGRMGVAEGPMGSSGHVGRVTGRVQALQLTDDGVVMLDQEALKLLDQQNIVDGLIDPATGMVNPRGVQTRYISTPQLNEMIAPILEREARKYNIPLPKGWDGQVFNANPIETMVDYVANMSDAIEAWQHIDALRRAGLAFTHSAHLDVQQVVQYMYRNITDIAKTNPTIKFGKPTLGATEEAPVRWLQSIAIPEEATRAAKELSEAEYTALKESIRTEGVKRPIRLSVWEDGSVEIIDGHHRLAAAEALGIRSVPVQVSREGVLEAPKNGVNVAHNLKPGWFQDTAGRIADIKESPQKYAFHASAEAKAEGALEKGLQGGGLYADRAAAEEFVRRPGEEARRILVFDREAMPPSLKNPLDRNGQIGDIRGAPKVKPIGSYDPEVGLESFVPAGGAGTLDDMTSFDMYEAFDQLPWRVEPDIDDVNLLDTPTGSVTGVPTNVSAPLTDAGFTVTDVTDITEIQSLATTIKTGTAADLAETAPVPRPNLFTGAEEFVDPKGGWVDTGVERIFSDGETPLLAAVIDPENNVLRLSMNTGLNVMQTQQARDAAIDLLDHEFKSGALKGMLSDTGIGTLVGDGLDQTTADLTHEFLRRKLGGLPPSVQEFIAKEPAEIFQHRMLWDDFVNGFNDFVSTAAALRDSKGNLIADPGNIAITPDAMIRQKLESLQAAAHMAGEAGYENAVKVMRDVEHYTGVNDIVGMVNPGTFSLAGPAIDGLQVQKDMGRWLSNMAGNLAMIHTPEGLAAAKLAANETLKWWRAVVTLPRPAFHIRNLIGGSYMNMAFGVRSKTMASISTEGIKFRNALRNATGVDALEQAFAAVSPKWRKTIEAAWERNVLAGFATTEFTDALTPAAMRSRFAWAKATDVDNFVLTRAGGRVMESVEDFMRLSLFAEYFDETVEGSAKHAAEMVNAVHFDYSNLTPLETKLKAAIPFFVWTRRNLPLQIRTVVENPRYYQRYRAMMQSMDDNFGGGEGELPQAEWYSAWAVGTGYKVNKDTPFADRIMIDPDLPIKDLLNLPNPEPGSILEFVNQLLGPHVSTLVDVNAQREFGDVNAPAPLSVVLKRLAAVGMFDKTMDGDVRIPYHIRTLMETALPFSRELFDPLTGGPTDPNRQQRVGIKPDDNLLERGLKTLGSQLAGGLGAKLTTPADARSRAFSSQDDIAKLIKELRLSGDLPPSQ